jgi:hypothetical protein
MARARKYTPIAHSPSLLRVKDYALQIIEENSAFWKRLVAGETEPKGISLYVCPLSSLAFSLSAHYAFSRRSPSCAATTKWHALID